MSIFSKVEYILCLQTRYKSILLSVCVFWILFVCYNISSSPQKNHEHKEIQKNSGPVNHPPDVIWPRMLERSRREFEWRNDFWQVVPPGGKMVEIGVFDGAFIKSNLAKFQQKFEKSDQPEYYAVDMHATPILKERIDEWSTTHPNFHFKLGKSAERANDFEDESLDVVYIDASHEFVDVDTDIKMWRPKLKKGGLLAGHDYCVSKEERKMEKYKRTAPWCGIYVSKTVMMRGKDSRSEKVMAGAERRYGTEVRSQRGSVDAVIKNLGVGKFSVTFEGRTNLDSGAYENMGNPSWYTFVD